MNKKKLVLVVLIGFLVINLFVYKLIKVEPKKYVVQNQDEITKKCEKLLAVSGERTDVYYKKRDCPQKIDISELYTRLEIEKISVEKKKKKYGRGYEDCVRIFVKDKPDDEEYQEAGIYYSPNNCTIDFYGHIANEDAQGIFLYDGRLKGAMAIYKSKRICNNWFYFERTVW